MDGSLNHLCMAMVVDFDVNMFVRENIDDDVDVDDGSSVGKIGIGVR